MLTHFYDIESLDNVFTLANYHPETHHLDIYMLCDDQDLYLDNDNIDAFQAQMTERIYLRNEDMAQANATVTLHELHTQAANEHLATTFGLSGAPMVTTKAGWNPYACWDGTYDDKFRLTCTTDPDFNEDIHPYLMGYNSYNYDTSELALYFYETFWTKEGTDEEGMPYSYCEIHPTTAYVMRQHNNEMFSKKFKSQMPTYLASPILRNGSYGKPDYKDQRWRIRKNMLLTGRHLDVARINEKMGKVALKRILGMMGRQILESDKLSRNQCHIYNRDQLLELIAYNVSDVVNLEWVFKHPDYHGSFIVKQGLLKQYPELIYLQKEDGSYKPDIDPDRVRADRLYPDSSSAQLATKTLCPYGHLKDIPAVSFMYPSKEKAQELGIKQVNVLEQTKDLFYNLFPQSHVRAEFDKIYDYYKALEGKNFNESKNYTEDYGKDALPLSNLKELTAHKPTCMTYFRKDGTPSSCFVNFSTGGVHGAEYNKALYDADMAAWEAEMADMAYVQTTYPDPLDMRKAKVITMPDGRQEPYKKFLTGKSTLKNAEYRDFSANKPQLFKFNKKGVQELVKKYTYTSAGLTNHEDFKSYYPNLLRMMMAFFNKGLGYDRYAEVFYQKEDYGFLTKEKNAKRNEKNASEFDRLQHYRIDSGLGIDPECISKEERELYGVNREGTKLLLNSASGAGDASFESNIRMNNQIISMRCIGQLFTSWIGMAQSYHGASVPSTNTDGLFTMMEEKENNRILEEESKNIGVEIEPELTYLISKDSNNRLEMDPVSGKILACGGGTLGRFRGPHSKGMKSLAHPAIIDWALAEYLIVSAFHHKGLSLETPFDDKIGMAILHSADDKFKDEEWLLMFQNVIASSSSTISQIFGETKHGQYVPLQHYNRVFFVKEETEETLHLSAAAARKITAATRTKREKNEERPVQHNPLARQILAEYGITEDDLDPEQEMVINKLTGIEQSWNTLIVNQDLYRMPKEQARAIHDNLDYDCYLQLLRNAYEKNWRNKVPGENIPDEVDTDDMEEDDEDL